MAPIDPIVLSSLADLQPSLYWLDADPLEPVSHSALVGDVTTDLVLSVLVTPGYGLRYLQRSEIQSVR